MLSSATNITIDFGLFFSGRTGIELCGPRHDSYPSPLMVPTVAGELKIGGKLRPIEAFTSVRDFGNRFRKPRGFEELERKIECWDMQVRRICSSGVVYWPWQPFHAGLYGVDDY